MVLGTIESYHQMYQIGLTVTLVLAGITVLLFFIFRVNKIVNDMAGITKRKELRLRETGESRVKKNMKEERLTKKAEKRKRKKSSEAMEGLKAAGGSPTEVLSEPGSGSTEILNAATERLKHAPDASEIRITILQEIMYVHADEVIVV